VVPGEWVRFPRVVRSAAFARGSEPPPAAPLARPPIPVRRPVITGIRAGDAPVQPGPTAAAGRLGPSLSQESRIERASQGSTDAVDPERWRCLTRLSVPLLLEGRIVLLTPRYCACCGASACNGPPSHHRRGTFSRSRGRLPPFRPAEERAGRGSERHGTTYESCVAFATLLTVIVLYV